MQTPTTKREFKTTDMRHQFFSTMGKKISAVCLAVLLLAATGCNKQLDIDSARQANEARQWTRFEDARSGLIGMYGLFRAAIASNNAHWLYGELRSGDFRSVFRPDLKAVVDGNLNASYPIIREVSDWRRFYAAVNACNLFIERVEGCLADQRYTESYLRVDVAQARALRAFLYFYMTRIWGDVPLITQSYDGGNFPEFERTNKDLVLSFAAEELLQAAQRLPFLYSGVDPEQLFPNNYYGLNQTQWANALITKTAAYALLAHISAWKGQYFDAAIYADFVVNNFGLTAPNQTAVVTTNTLVSPTGLFNAAPGNYRQLIGFGFNRENGETTTEGHIEQLTLASTNNFPMSKQLPDIYVPKNVISEVFPRTAPFDNRFGVDTSTAARLPFTNYFENFSAEIPVFKKIRVVDGGNNTTGKYAVFNSSIVFSRLEEIKLLRAEAYAVIGRTADALRDLNDIRVVRGVPGVIPGPGVDLVDEVFAERRRELMGEGWRWYDQVRYNKLKRNNPTFNNLLDQDGIYWPLSQEVLNRNKKLTQNSYWQ